MEKTLQQLITGEQLLTWLIIAFLVGYFVYKEWPEFKKRVSGAAVKEATATANDKSITDRLTAIEEDVRQIKDKLDRDYGRLNEMEKWKKTIEQVVAESLEEREILLMAAAWGLLFYGAMVWLIDRGEKAADKAVKEASIDAEE